MADELYTTDQYMEALKRLKENQPYMPELPAHLRKGALEATMLQDQARYPKQPVPTPTLDQARYAGGMGKPSTPAYTPPSKGPTLHDSPAGWKDDPRYRPTEPAETRQAPLSHQSRKYLQEKLAAFDQTLPEDTEQQRALLRLFNSKKHGRVLREMARERATATRGPSPFDVRRQAIEDSYGNVAPGKVYSKKDLFEYRWDDAQGREHIRRIRPGYQKTSFFNPLTGDKMRFKDPREAQAAMQQVLSQANQMSAGKARELGEVDALRLAAEKAGADIGMEVLGEGGMDRERFAQRVDEQIRNQELQRGQQLSSALGIPSGLQLRPSEALSVKSALMAEGKDEREQYAFFQQLQDRMRELQGGEAMASALKGVSSGDMLTDAVLQAVQSGQTGARAAEYIQLAMNRENQLAMQQDRDQQMQMQEEQTVREMQRTMWQDAENAKTKFMEQSNKSLNKIVETIKGIEPTTAIMSALSDSDREGMEAIGQFFKSQSAASGGDDVDPRMKYAVEQSAVMEQAVHELALNFKAWTQLVGEQQIPVNDLVRMQREFSDVLDFAEALSVYVQEGELAGENKGSVDSAVLDKMLVMGQRELRGLANKLRRMQLEL